MTGIWKVYGDPEIYPVLPGFILSVLLFVVVSLSTKAPHEKLWKPYFDK
jgi:Na+/proline symporter